MAQIWSSTLELPHAMGMAKKKFFLTNEKEILNLNISDESKRMYTSDCTSF